jgi:LemA protein
MTLGGFVFLAVLALLVGLAIAAYNRLVRLRQRADAAWSDIDVQLKRRRDLVPNLVETVKGYAAHEEATLQRVVRARAATVGAAAGRARAEALTDALRGLFAVAEAYPELEANVNFQELQRSLGEVEDALQDSRRYYNAVARDLNTAIETFPSNVVASVFRFARRAYFEVERPDERQVPRVSFGV